ncbi:MAG TPA: VWA domain-containing protein [Gemmatimonadales bacterium]|jgi:Ca-activated chloride channel family protein
MSFAEPVALLLLALVPISAWLAFRRVRDHRASLRRFGDPALLARASRLPDARLASPRAVLGVLGLGFAVLALARPQWGERQGDVAQTGRDLLVLLDLSRSMTVADLMPTRLAVAKRAAWETVSASPGDRVGLEVFGGSAFLQLPLTSNRAAFRLFLDAASTDDLGDPATDLAGALATAAKVFEHEGERGHRAILIVSDGESGEGGLDDAIARLRTLEVPVFALGVATAQGAPIPADSSELPEKFHRDHIGRIAISRLEQAELRHAAEATGGAFARWDNRDERARLAQALRTLRAGTLSSRKSPERADRFQWPLALAIAALLGELALAAGMGRRHVAVGAAVIGTTISGCGRGTIESWRGERSYADGEFAASSAAFEKALAADSTPARAFNAGNALYRMRHYEDAAKRYRLVLAGEPKLRQRGAFNLGNALLRAAENAPERPELLHGSIRAYEEALRLDPSDADAKWNLEIALRRLADDRQSGGSPGRTRNADYGRGNMSSSGYEGNPDAAVGAMAGGGFGSAEGESVEELDAEQARRLLEAVQREQLQTHEGRRMPESRGGERDW